MRHGLRYTGLPAAAAFRKRYLDQTMSREDFERLELMDFVWFRSEWIWEQQIVHISAGAGGVQGGSRQSKSAKQL
jgi:hypothetical protein